MENTLLAQHDQDCSIILLMMIMPRTTLLTHLDDHPDCTMFHDCTDDDHAKGHNNARNDDYPDCTMFHECSDDDDDDAKDHLAGPDSPSLKEGGLCRVRIVQEGGSTSEMIRNFNNNIINDINNLYAFKPGGRRDQQ